MWRFCCLGACTFHCRALSQRQTKNRVWEPPTKGASTCRQQHRIVYCDLVFSPACLSCIHWFNVIVSRVFAHGKRVGARPRFQRVICSSSVALRTPDGAGKAERRQIFQQIPFLTFRSQQEGNTYAPVMRSKTRLRRPAVV